MSIPKTNFWGQTAQLTMTELRRNPGEAFYAVSCGLTIEVTKGGRPVAVISPPKLAGDVDTIIHPDGTWTGERPLTARGGEHG